ncbi:MAG: Trk system potassium uptake protein TrkH [Bacteroidota bacterium]|nr:MAG: Trk system potassium uptake protein TrkH [Bacteroidota bacterium]
MKGYNLKLIVHILGLLLLFNSLFIGITTLSSYFMNDGAVYGMLKAFIINVVAGGLAMGLTLNHRKEIKKREGYLIVVFGWLIMVIFGTLPFVFTNAVSSISDALFETMSGYTATGATIMDNIESLPKSIILWRSLTHWMGGMGIIVLAIAILPLLGIGGMQLFSAEAPVLGGDKLHPRISDTAKRLWLIYVGLTVINALLLSLSGMSVFDAVNHAMSTMASGGFSTKDSSLGYWNDIPQIQYITVIFMFLAGSNFVLLYYALKGKFKRVFSDTEFRWYAGFIGAFVLIVTTSLMKNGAYTMVDSAIWTSLEQSFRHALFQVVAVITTTGLVTSDFTAWSPFITMLFFGLMFLGGSTGSTSGGVKVMRHLILIKNGFLEFKRALHPNAILMVRLNKISIEQSIVYNVLAFFILYLILFIIGAGVLSILGLDFTSAIGGAAASLGNVGPGLGDLGPATTYASLPTLGKLWCALLMLIGRLELFTVLILFTPYYWRKR